MLPQDQAGQTRVFADDLRLAYRQRQRGQAELALADMIADAERLGLYDADPDEVKTAVRVARKQSRG